MLLSNLFKVTSDVAADRLGPRTKIKGMLLAGKQCNNNFICLDDSNWKISSMNYANVLRDVDDNAVTVFLKKHLSPSWKPQCPQCPLTHVRSW